ncbi:MAG: molybdenum transporter [Methanobacteriota archaeon]
MAVHDGGKSQRIRDGNAIAVKGKIWLERGSRFVLGEGRAELLRGVRASGSLAEAARSMGMAYSHAWSEIKAISEAAGGKVVKSAPGGKRGGGSRLTRLGEKLLDRFDLEMKRMGAHLSRRNR